MNLDFALVLSVLTIGCFWSVLDFFLAKSLLGKIMEAFWFVLCVSLTYFLLFSYEIGKEVVHFTTTQYVIYIMIYLLLCVALMYRGLRNER